jgi:hypothetical protein
MNILKHVINQKIDCKDKKFNVKWTLKDKNLQQSCHLKIENIYPRKVLMHFTNKFCI